MRRPGDDAAIQVVEAILVAILIVSGLLFMTLMTRPSVPVTAGGGDMQESAQGMLRILEEATVPDPLGGPALTFEAWVDAIMRGNNGTAPYDTYGSDVASAVDALRRSVTPVGLQSMVRIHNGAGTMVLSPVLGPGDSLRPVGAAVAVTYIRPSWNMTASAVETYAPGEDTGSTPSQVVAPTGETTAPGNTTWAAWWQDGIVPEGAPLGTWILDGTAVEVRLAGVPETDRPAYGIEVVVWRGA